MYRKFKQWFCVVRAKNPARLVLYTIFMINVAILLLTTLLIMIIQYCKGNETGFLLQTYKMVLMMIGAIDINDVIDQTAIWDVHMVFSAIFYLFLIFTTMISFTGALIGYLTNKISHYVEYSNAGAHPLDLSEHIVILNWNNRAAEIINDMLYKQKRELIVVLVQDGKENIETEIKDRLSDTVRKENKQLSVQYKHLPLIQRRRIISENRLRNKLTIIVRQGDIYAAERLIDISVGQAKSIIILYPGHIYCGIKNDSSNQVDKEHEDCSTVKLLMQVSEIAGNETSRNNQPIIVEINNDWTMELVQHIIQQKQKSGKSNIIAVPVNHILGDILAQVIIMPELNLVYNELFSYRGAEFFTKTTEETDEISFTEKYLAKHANALPLTVMNNNSVYTGYYIAVNLEDINTVDTETSVPYTADLNNEYQIEEKSVIILGHSSKSLALLRGLSAFDKEWRGQRTSPVLDVTVIDDETGLTQNDHYSDCPIIRKCVSAGIFDKDIICKEVSKIISNTQHNVSILILSDDTTDCDDTDRNVFTHLIYIQSVINAKLHEDPSFSRNRIDIIVELCNPKNADIIANYSISYVIISNRYISRLFNHLGEKEALYYFLTDILTYDDINGKAIGSKEVYSKRVGDFFRTMPVKVSVWQLIRAVYMASPPENKAIVIGYLSVDKQLTLFTGNQHSYSLDLKPDDSLVIFSNH
ncbi:MAG: hypothetical protein JW811_07795 [Clostridiales bacterium]|nr:hypothetical protein [Clostridiales bacterium]